MIAGLVAFSVLLYCDGLLVHIAISYKIKHGGYLTSLRHSPISSNLDLKRSGRNGIVALWYCGGWSRRSCSIVAGGVGGVVALWQVEWAEL